MVFDNGVPSHRQQVVLAICPKIAAIVSIMGSAYVLYDCSIGFRRRRTVGQSSFRSSSLRNWGRSASTYHRLMMGLSICDICMSAGFFSSTWAMPHDTADVWGAKGNTASCEALGFLEQAGMAAVLYNASLSTYYLLRIRCGWQPHQFIAKRVELWLHLIPVVLGLTTMIAGIPLALYNSGIFDCWIAPFPQGCSESWRKPDVTAPDYVPCERGDNATLYTWVFDLIPKWSGILIVTINMIATVRAMWVQERSAMRYAEHFRNQSSDDMTSAEHRKDKRCGNNLTDSSADTNENISQPASSATNLSSAYISLGLSKARLPENKVKIKPKMAQRLARQSYLYVGALYITYIPVIITRLTQLLTGDVYYEMLLTISITIPLQGFWNLLVYLRPRYLQQQQRLKQERDRLRALSPRSSSGKPYPSSPNMSGSRDGSNNGEQNVSDFFPQAEHSDHGSRLLCFGGGVVRAMAVSLQEGDLSEDEDGEDCEMEQPLEEEGEKRKDGEVSARLSEPVE